MKSFIICSCSSSNIIKTIIKENKPIINTRDNKSYKILAWKAKGGSLFWRTRRRMEDNIKIDPNPLTTEFLLNNK
jgi:hypothetical protein